MGSLAAAVSSRFLESLLFEVTRLDPIAYVTPAVGLAIATVLAAWIPALASLTPAAS